MTFITIDGDDVGLKMRSFYLGNDPSGLSAFVEEVNAAMMRVRSHLLESGWEVVFCAADGVAAQMETEADVVALFDSLKTLAPRGVSLSAGFGKDLRQAYIALLAAKSSGKGRICDYADLRTLGN